jgi:hypothetical protein
MMRKVYFANASTRTPGRQRQNCANYLAGEFAGGGLDGSACVGSLGFQFSLCLAHPLPGGATRDVHRGIAFRVPLLDALLAKLVDVSPGVAEIVGILLGALFRPGNRLMCLFDSAFGARAALLQGPAQRRLNKELICQDQHDKEQNRGYGSEQKGPDLLQNFIHADINFSSGDQCKKRIGSNIFLYQAKAL